jgi:class 3 adenylate cyclase/tetratricopeptide (TPR) repeat protein
MPEERKLVTILFADVIGSTALGDTLDPEDVRALMGRYYMHARRILPIYGGTLEKFIGDAVMAVFGLPQAHGDDAERALAAALALREAVSSDEVLKSAFSLRIGVNTGEVIATNNPADGEFLVTGDAVNVAARLQQQGNPGEILVGERCMKAAQRAFLFEAARLIEVKGKRAPLQSFPLTCERKMRQVEHPPFVGRRQDLLQLNLLKERALEEQHPQLISIVAPAGTGKSRLLAEFLHRLPPEDGFQVAVVRCLPYGQTLAYWPLRGLLSELVGETISRERVTEIFLQGGYEAADTQYLTDCVLVALGIEQESACEIDRDAIFTAWRLVIEIVAKQAPRVIIFEDLHWASDSLLDLVEHILHLRIQAPILLITLSRPELLDRRPHWGGGQANFTALTLQPLTAMQTRDLVGRLLGTIAETTREQIVERSAGNPFFTLELIRGLSERGLTEGVVTLDALPDTVHGLIQARLDLLSPRERELLQVAAVATRPFRPLLLESVLEGYSVQEREEAIEGLLARDLLIPGDGGTVFIRHALIRDVAYGMLSRAERIRWHNKIAACLERLASQRLDEYTELIAYHHLEAVRLARQSAVPLEPAIQPERALHFLKRAGELASRAGAFIEARNHLQSAIEIAPESELRELYELLGDYTGWSDTAINSYNKALKRWHNEGAQEPLVGARLLRKLLVNYTRGAHSHHPSYEELAQLNKEAQQLAEEAGDEDELRRIYVAGLFKKHHYNNEPADLAEEQAKALAAIEYFQHKGDWTAFSEACDGYASLALQAGANQEALEASRRRLLVADLPALEIGDAIQMIARCYAYLGNYDKCIKIIQEAVAQLRPGQPLTHLYSGIAYAIFAAFITGRWSDANGLFPFLQDRQFIQSEYSPLASHCEKGYYSLLQIALAHEDRGAIETIVTALSRIYPETTSVQRLQLNAFLTDEVPKIENVASHEHKEIKMVTLAFYNEHGALIPPAFIEQLYQPGWRYTAAQDYLAIAEALAADDNERLAQAIEDTEAHQLIVHAARMRIVLAQRTRDKAHLDKARPVLERLGDRHFLNRLQEVEAALASHAAA